MKVGARAGARVRLEVARAEEDVLRQHAGEEYDGQHDGGELCLVRVRASGSC